MSEVIQDYDEYTLSDFLPENMDIINRGEMPEPLTLEIVNRVNWHTVVDVHGDSRDAKLVMKALTSYDTNQELIAKQAEQIKMLRDALVVAMPDIFYDENGDEDKKSMQIILSALESTKEQA